MRAPSAEFVEQCTKEQLLKLAEHYNVYVSDKRLKENVKAFVMANLYDLGVLKSMTVPLDERTAAVSVGAQDAGSNLTFEQQNELLTLRFQLEKQKELELEQVRRKADYEKTVALEKFRQHTELARLDLETQRMTHQRGQIAWWSGR